MEISTSAAAVPSDLTAGLRRIARRTLSSAGPRYAPACNPDAPNLAIESLQRAASALSIGATLRTRATELGDLLGAACSGAFRLSTWG